MNKIKRHGELCKAMHDTYERKNKDYGDSFGKTYEELGIISAVTRITDKYNRMVQLAKGNERQVHDESIKDTLMDMANYCIMTYMEIEQREVVEKSETANYYNPYGMAAGVERG